jgi:hypothetical protein
MVLPYSFSIDIAPCPSQNFLQAGHAAAAGGAVNCKILQRLNAAEFYPKCLQQSQEYFSKPLFINEINQPA